MRLISFRTDTGLAYINSEKITALKEMKNHYDPNSHRDINATDIFIYPDTGIVVDEDIHSVLRKLINGDNSVVVRTE